MSVYSICEFQHCWHIVFKNLHQRTCTKTSTKNKFPRTQTHPLQKKNLEIHQFHTIKPLIRSASPSQLSHRKTNRYPRAAPATYSLSCILYRAASRSRYHRATAESRRLTAARKPGRIPPLLREPRKPREYCLMLLRRASSYPMRVRRETLLFRWPWIIMPRAGPLVLYTPSPAA